MKLAFEKEKRGRSLAAPAHWLTFDRRHVAVFCCLLGSVLLGPAPHRTQASESNSKPLTVAMMPKSKGNAYFISCKKGAEIAAKELGVKLLWDGPTDPDPARQNEIVETWITRGVDVIAVAVENRAGISTSLRKARQNGIKVITWDSDAEPDAREFLVN